MAFSDLCKISNAYKAVENEPDQSERIMEENSMVRDLITKILDDAGPSEGQSSAKTSDKALGINLPTTQYPKTSGTNTSFVSPATSYNTYQDTTSLYNFPQNDQSSFNFNLQNGFGNSNGFVNYDNDVNSLLGIEPVVTDPTSDVTPEQLNLLRLAAQEIGGAQFTSPNSNDKFYNFFEPSQRNSLPETNMFQNNNFNRPNSLNLESHNFNANLVDSNPYNASMQRFPNKFPDNFLKESHNGQDHTDLLAYLNQLNMALERPRDDVMTQNNITDFKMPVEMNGHFQNDEHFNKMADGKGFNFNNRNFQQMPPHKNFNGDNNFYLNEMMKNMTNGDNKNFAINQNFDYQNQNQIPNGNFKPNGFHPNDFAQRSQMMQRDNFQSNGALNEQRMNLENPMQRDGMQQAAMMRQNQELARQMSLLMRNRPPPNQLNVDVSFLHENAPFNLGLGALLGPSTSVPPPVLPSPMLDLPLLAPFYAMRNMRTAHTSSAILHARLDACYEQWRQLERERKRTEARLALAYPGRAVSSSNSIPVPRLPPCPTRVDRLTVDMLREHTKVLTLMGKMETLRASVCVAQNKRPHKDAKITVLKRGQENILPDNKEKEGIDPATFVPATWKEDVSCLHEIAPHSEVESAMLAWRSAVGAVQAARRRELAPHNDRFVRSDPILQLADAVKQLGISARRARCAMWCDLTLTVALAPGPTVPSVTEAAQKTSSTSSQQSSTNTSPKQTAQETNNGAIQTNAAKLTTTDIKEEKSSSNDSSTRSEAKPTENTNDKTANKQPEKTDQKQNQQRRQPNYRHKINQPGRSNDFYQKNQRYDNRFMQNRHPYHYLATGPIN